MSKRREIFFSLLLDFVMLNAAYVVYYLYRVKSGLVAVELEPELLAPMIAIYLYWLFCFWFFGLYRPWYMQSRLGELFTLFNTTIGGTIILFLLIFFDDSQTGGTGNTRLVILVYWATLFACVGAGRLILRWVQHRMLAAGYGGRQTIIIGGPGTGYNLCDLALDYPSLGYRPAGFVSTPASDNTKEPGTAPYRGIPVLGTLEQLPELLSRHNVKEVLVGLESHEHDLLLEVIRLCEGYEVGIKIIPDLYNIISGQARVLSLYGFPLMEISPILIKPWEESAKRVFDVTIAAIILLLGAPVWLINIIILKIDSRGPVLYSQERVGKNGKVFKIYKFRSMVADAEKKSGPVWAGKNDARVTWWGRVMRKTHLDEVPQFWNVLVGDMSLVGPRPERPVFVEQLSKEIPLYKRRLRVKPGITGWAQVKHEYDQTIEDVKTKIKFDLFYIENMSWRMDLIILFNTLYVMIRGKGHA